MLTSVIALLSAHLSTGTGIRHHVPSIRLYNAADPDLRMPVIGLGTGGYPSAKSPMASPEHWDEAAGFENTLKWFNIGGARWDSAFLYESRGGVAAALLNVTNDWTTTKREDIFITDKVGAFHNNMGFEDVLAQLNDTLELFNTEYVDLLLIHWPSWNGRNSIRSTDPFCNTNQNNPEYSASKCRQSTWRAMESAFKSGKARAIGVSNFEQRHLEDIFALKSEIPAVNQFEYVLSFEIFLCR